MVRTGLGFTGDSLRNPTRLLIVPETNQQTCHIVAKHIETHHKPTEM